jgi:cytochrome b561
MTDRTTFDSVTRIAAGDEGRNYDNVVIALHWLTALLVFVQFGTALSWDWFSRGTREAMESTHVSLGILLTAVILARLVWRSIPTHRRAAVISGWMKTASTGVHYLLYLMLVVQAGLGWAIGWATGKPIHFFGIPIPGPLDALSRAVRHDLREIHETLGWAIVVLALAHALAALYHHYFLKDRVLGRMLPWAAHNS